jgi:hypothetical protein
MKKVLLLTILISSIGIAQKAYIGPQLGMNLIQLNKEDNGRNFHPGWYGGAAFDYQFTDWFGLQTGIMYTQKRQAYSDADTIPIDFFGLIDSSFTIDGLDLNSYNNIEGRTSQHYFELPLMASFNYKGLTAGVGGYFGVMFTARKRQKEITNTPLFQAIDVGTLIEGFTGGSDSTGGGGFGGFGVEELFASLLPAAYEEEFTEATDISDLRRLDYGLRFNVGYQPNAFGVFATYQLGLPDFRTSIPAGGEKSTHNYFQFSIRYMFGLGRGTSNPSMN